MNQALTSANLVDRAITAFPVLKEPYRQLLENYLVIDEDNDVAERQYIGLTNPLTPTGRFSKYEQSVYWFQNWVVDRVVGPTEQKRLSAAA